MLAYLLLRGVVELFRLIPFPVLYLLSDALAFLLRVLVGYRRGVIHSNLQRAFPEKNESEIRQIARKTYRNLTDITLETIKSQTASVTEIQRRCRTVNPELVTQCMDEGRSVILAGSHTGNWEYAGLTLPLSLSRNMVGVYKPLTNKYIDKFMGLKRMRGGIVLAAMDEVLNQMRKNKNDASWSYMLIADQSPSSRKRAHWVEFFGRTTAALPGVDVLARNFDMPVFAYRIKRIRRGYYEINFEALCLNPSETKETEITKTYTQRLEQEIRSEPENWLWSHKRWKMTKTES